MNLSLEDCQIDLDTRTITRGDQKTRLTGTEVSLLRYLTARPHEVISREELYREVWKHQAELLTRTLDLAIFRLRKKIEKDPSNPDHVMTVYGRGYHFVPKGEDAQPPQAPGQGANRATNLGREENHFFGREDEQRALTELMETRSGFITVLGPPGTGKTRLTKHWAAERLSSGAVSSAWFCDLTEARSEEGVIQAVATDLGVSLTTKKEGVEALASLVGDAIQALGSTIVVVDNAEQVVEWAGPLVAGWWQQAPQASFVVTSQAPTGVSMEQRMPLAPLPMPGGEDVGAPCPAVQLFVDRAQSVQPSFEQTAGNHAAIADIVRALDGLPLAIELAAARMHLMSPAALHARLADRFRMLKRPKQAGSARHQTLQAALDWSWDLLEPWEQATLAQCSVFHGGFDWEAVEAVVDLSDWPQAPWSVDVVAELVERSLVMVHDDKGGMARLSLLASVTEYVRKKLSESTQASARGTWLRHARHYAHFGSKEYTYSLSTPGSVARMWRIHTELENLVAGIDVAMDSTDLETAARCALGAANVLAKQGPFLRAVTILKRLNGHPLSTSTEGQVLYFLGWMLKLNGQIEQSKAAYEEALEISHQSGDTYRESLTLASLATLVKDQGDTTEALRFLEAALKIAQSSGHTGLKGNALARLGVLKAGCGQIPEALEHYRQAIAMARELGNRSAEGISTGNMANLYFELGEFTVAQRHYEKSVEISREIGNQRGLGIGLTNLAKLHHALGEFDKAHELYATALVIVRQTGELRIEGFTLGSLGNLLYSQGRLGSAEEHLKQGISICDKVLPSAAAYFRSLLALVRSDQGEFTEARDLLEAAEEQLTRTVGLAELGKLHCTRARVELAAGDAVTAVATLSKAEAIAAELKVKPGHELGKAIAEARALIGS